jgi:phosphohistidine phosphatase SixA
VSEKSSREFACYVVRHADAGKRGAIADDRRSLSRRGRAQSDAIADELAHAGITRLLASPYTRCVETLEPLSARIDVEVETIDDLGEGSGAAAALALIDTAGSPIAICSHGDVIGAVVEALDHRGVPRDDDRVAKASTWVVTCGPDGVVDAHYVPAPRIEEP